MSEAPAFLQGRLLIATPAIGDARFTRTVILICAHSQDHAMGVIVNKPMNGLRLPDLLDQLGVEDADMAADLPVLKGGPVERERGFVLHTDDYVNEEATMLIGGGVGLTATRDVLSAIVAPDGPSRAILALGYAGWGPGQIEREIQSNAWLTCAPDLDLVFGADLDAKWGRALRSIGVAPEKLSGLSGEA